MLAIMLGVLASFLRVCSSRVPRGVAKAAFSSAVYMHQREIAADSDAAAERTSGLYYQIDADDVGDLLRQVGQASRRNFLKSI